MGRSQETFNKRENEKKRFKKKQDKLQKKEERKSNPDKKGIDDMIAYVDEYGNITSTPPDPNKKKEVIKAEDIQLGVAKQEPIDPQDLIRRGTVTFFNNSKGYGFIKDLDTQESIFVHVNGLEEEVQERDKVTFETEMGQKGLNAINVKLAKKEVPVKVEEVAKAEDIPTATDETIAPTDETIIPEVKDEEKEAEQE